MPAKLTTLYAVWGYDTDEDGTADVKETTYTLTYNANGGKFTEEKETKEVTVVAQDGYKLLARKGFPPMRKRIGMARRPLSCSWVGLLPNSKRFTASTMNGL